ncbi:MAG: hypothetical protein ABJB47_18990, partial [Actinomycetota bacterium]
VTTSGLALTLAWPSQVILAECDPSGGDVLAGLFAGHVAAGRGLLSLAFDAGRGVDDTARALWAQLIELDDARERMLLAGISDPRQTVGLASSWPALADLFATVPPDVIADCGRLDAVEGPLAVLSQAQVVVLVMCPTLRQVARAKPRVEMLDQLLGGVDRVRLLLAGEGTQPAKDISRALGIPVIGTLPRDEKTASVLSDGTGPRRNLHTRPLIRAAGMVGRAIRATAGTALAGGAAGLASGVVYPQ